MSKRIYVGNLTDDITSSDLEALFAPFGTVQGVQIVLDRDTNRSKGFAFVMMDDAQADAAISGLDAREYVGRALMVQEAKSTGARLSRGGGGSSSGRSGGSGGGWSGGNRGGGRY